MTDCVKQQNRESFSNSKQHLNTIRIQKQQRKTYHLAAAAEKAEADKVAKKAAKEAAKNAKAGEKK